jgi:hypothetical protein
MDLSGHHSNPPAPLDALLNDPSGDAEAGREQARPCATGAPGKALGAPHPRQGRIIDAISRVLTDERHPLQARDVHARVETLLGEPVRWSYVKATLSGNLDGPAPRFLRVARGRYRTPQPDFVTVSRIASTNPTHGHGWSPRPSYPAVNGSAG